MNNEIHTDRILTRKVRKSGSQGLALMLMLSGIFLMLFAWWPIGLLCIIGAFFADAKYEQAHYCPVCGNDVTPTSRLCPICNNALVAAKPSTGESIRAVIIALLVIVVIVTAFLLFASIRSGREAREGLERSAKERREQMAREIAARSEYNEAKERAEKQRKEATERAVMEAKIKRALDMAKNGGTEIPPLPPITPSNQGDSLPPPGMLSR